MSLTRVTDLIDEIEAFQLNQLIALLEGDTGAGHPVAITALNNAIDWAFQAANQDPTNGRAMRVLKPNLTDPWLQIDVDGTTIESLRLRHIDTPSAPGSSLMELHPKTDDLLYFCSGAAGVETRLARYGELIDSVLTTQGDLPYASAANTPARLGIGTARQALLTNAGATGPEWGVSMQSLMAAQGDLPYASAANTPARLGVGSTGQALTVAAGVPVWGAIDSVGIAANAVTQRQDGGSTPTASTTSASYVTLDSVTFTAKGGDILVMFSAQAYNATAGNQIAFGAQIDSGSVKDVSGNSQPAASPSYYQPFAGFALFTGVSAGSITVKLLWKSLQGSTIATLVASGQFTVLEIKK